MSGWEATLRIASALIALVIVLLLAWLLLRWMNKRVPGMGGGGRLVKVLDRVPAGKNSSFILLRVEDKVMLVAVSDHAIEKLYEVDDPEGKLTPPKPAEFGSFSNALKDAAKRFGKKNGDGGGGL